MSNSKRANALPFLGRGPAPDEHSGEQELAQGFLAVAMIFARTWPFIRPYIIGYWHEVRIGEDSRELPQSMAADSAANDGVAAEPTPTEKEWSFKHIPPLATLTAALGPLLGVLPLTTSWVYDFLLVVTACMAGLCVDDANP